MNWLYSSMASAGIFLFCSMKSSLQTTSRVPRPARLPKALGWLQPQEPTAAQNRLDAQYLAAAVGFGDFGQAILGLNFLSLESIATILSVTQVAFEAERLSTDSHRIRNLVPFLGSRSSSILS